MDGEYPVHVATALSTNGGGSFEVWAKAPPSDAEREGLAEAFDRWPVGAFLVLGSAYRLRPMADADGDREREIRRRQYREALAQVKRLRAALAERGVTDYALLGPEVLEAVGAPKEADFVPGRIPKDAACVTTMPHPGPPAPSPDGREGGTKGVVESIICTAADWLSHADAIRRVTGCSRVTLTTMPAAGRTTLGDGSLRLFLEADRPEGTPRHLVTNCPAGGWLDAPVPSAAELLEAEWPGIAFRLPSSGDRASSVPSPLSPGEAVGYRCGACKDEGRVPTAPGRVATMPCPDCGPLL